VRITFQLTPKDYHQGLLAWRSLKTWRRWLLRCAYFLVGLTILLSLLLPLVRPGSEMLKIWAAPFAFAVIWFAFMLGAPWLSARQQYRNTPTAQTPITIETSDTGLYIQSAHADSRVAWSAYVAWGENKSVFVILPQPRIYVPIPKRAFTAEQQSEFRELLLRNIKPPQTTV
jgi:YcxB-like protein